MEHSEYIEHLRQYLDARSGSDDFLKSVEAHEEELLILSNLNLDPALPVLTPLYCPVVRRKPRDCLCMLRALIFMTLLKITSITKWVKMIKAPVYAILCGFDPDDTPGVGTFYDFKKRIIDGPYRKPIEDLIKRSQYNAKKHKRNLKGEKKEKKNDFDPNHSKSEILSKKLLAENDMQRQNDINSILEDLLFEVGIIPSIEDGLLSLSDYLIVSGDGSILETFASSQGKPTCNCRKQGVYKCDHDRFYTSPTASFCYEHVHDRFIFGDRYYHLITTQNGHDFPLLSLIPGGNESDYTLSLTAFDRFIKAAGENGTPCHISAFCGDGHHDSNAHYHYFLQKEVAPIIPLSQNSKSISHHLPGRNQLRLDCKGTPLCPVGLPMHYQQYNKRKKTHIYNCPAKRAARRGGKRHFVFHRDDCPNKKDCMPKSTMAPFVYIKSSDDPRMYPPIPRDSKRFKNIMNQRSASERINFINDNFNLERSCTNADYGLVRIFIANIAHHAKTRYKEKKDKYRESGPLSEILKKLIPRSKKKSLKGA